MSMPIYRCFTQTIFFIYFYSFEEAYKLFFPLRWQMIDELQNIANKIIGDYN